MDWPRGRAGVYRLLSTSWALGTKIYLLAERNVPVDQERAKPILKHGIYDLVQLFMDQPRGRVGVYRLLSTSRGPGTKLYLLAERNAPVEQKRHSKITFPIHRGDC
ncbi:hypothetical protein CDAR_231491 [Caerostris darwini]|uniref:Uncharacterized protein n=1 Tax=Caerostris darwini TaxID=1538125 RepID=A0AAV4T9K8_9ARAC|nr:hypothetical protein CDAR_231491 [Caerostris darwini]